MVFARRLQKKVTNEVEMQRIQLRRNYQRCNPHFKYRNITLIPCHNLFRYLKLPSTTPFDHMIDKLKYENRFVDFHTYQYVQYVVVRGFKGGE